MRIISARQAWVPVVGFEETHLVSPAGEVMTKERKLVNRNGVVRRWPAAILKPTRKSNGYMHITLTSKDGSAKTMHIHRIVLEAFVGPCPSGCEALHVDGVKDNNALWNLRWGTHVENCEDRTRHGTSGRVLDMTSAKEIRNLKGRMKQAEIAKRYGVSQSIVSQIHRNKVWREPEVRQ